MKTKMYLALMICVGVMSSMQLSAQRKPTTCELRTDMRKLWEDHITWTRNVIFNFIDTLPGTNEAVTRLLQNQQDIGDAFKPYYGNAVGDSIASLFRTHITTAAAVLIALRDNDAAGLATANDAWYDNGEDIVAYMSSLNPHWPEADLDAMMDEHLDLTANEAVARKNQDYAADIAAYDAVHNEILEMSDFFVDGLVAQFPGKFSRGTKMLSAQSIELSNSNGISVEQNIPNPFADETQINYSIPDDVLVAEIQFMDARGRLVKSEAITGRGDGIITVYANSLSKGVYTYTVIADGKIIDSKKMVH